VEDLRLNPTFVFAGFLDVLYDAGIIQPSDTNQGDQFDFDVEFGPGYAADAGVGTAARSGIIDEFGTLFSSPSTAGPNPGLLATLFFDAVGVGTASVVGSPADSSPFQDTLLFQKDDPVDRTRIRFDSLQFNVTAGSNAPLQNFSLPQDVNNDGAVSPIDALLIINEVSRVAPMGEGELAGSDPIIASRYYDVNGDQRTSALDALQVINYLKRASDSEPNGEAVAQDLSVPATSSSSDDTDEVFAVLNDDDVAKIVSTDLPAGQASGGIDLVVAQDADEEEDDEVLDLLASDVLGFWK
jgi:hypothetical protein